MPEPPCIEFQISIYNKWQLDLLPPRTQFATTHKIIKIIKYKNSPRTQFATTHTSKNKPIKDGGSTAGLPPCNKPKDQQSN